MALRNAGIARVVTMVALASVALAHGASTQSLRRAPDASSLLAPHRVTTAELRDFATVASSAYRFHHEGGHATTTNDAAGVRRAMRSLNRGGGTGAE
jgi:hypothetical protein